MPTVLNKARKPSTLRAEFDWMLNKSTFAVYTIVPVQNLSKPGEQFRII